MSHDDDRQTAFDDAVEAYNHAHPTATLPRSAARLLGAMFADCDICRLSLDALSARGFNRGGLIRVLRALGAAGLLSTEQGGGRSTNAYQLHLPPKADAS
jgi:hypothetical protein